ncbi:MULTISPECIES: AraC family transcriptional regulator [Paenibacillus]|uniref:AraC family transcriptional regulator n=1 Tax=Paenibacillus TaxID=44249 RepID=UPI00041D92D8|nr:MULTISPECIES: AraC family transcriptional regulator [Paenibacillus]KGP80271.1 AraC family transcriptional regulator [Paenibacillus sp. MAEPY1]KGP80279.1 AraC family transcriptional regulator [Paenibacillus sp. MAEPY2]OZQ59276.1 AraC family transcriptional regulator [Paenibacillus taichungensis]HBU82408.1 AraC family transcriptional regulator [Paenibacillus sp.]
MNYKESVIKAISYIEDHMFDENLNVKITEVTGYSQYHFHRIFLSVTRCSVSEYIRKRRLTRATYDLFHTNQRIIEIAIKCGFESQEAFARAFRKMFSISPGQFRKQRDMKDTLFRTMEMHPLNEERLQHLHTGISLEPSLVHMEKLNLVGMSIRGVESDEVGLLWRSFRQRVSEIKRKPNSEGIYYAVIELTGEQWEVAYTACVEAGNEASPAPAGMIAKLFPATTYAVFSHKGPLDRLNDTFQYIYETWLPQSGSVRTNAPEFARYDWRFLGPTNEDSVLDIYIPICSPS